MATAPSDTVCDKGEERNETDSSLYTLSQYFYIPGYSADVVDFPSGDGLSSELVTEKEASSLSKDYQRNETDSSLKILTKYFYIPGYSADVVDFPSDDHSSSEAVTRTKTISLAEHIKRETPGKTYSEILGTKFQSAERGESQYHQQHVEDVTQQDTDNAGESSLVTTSSHLKQSSEPQSTSKESQDKKLLNLEYKMLLTRFEMKPHLYVTASKLNLPWVPEKEEGQAYVSIMRELIHLRTNKLREDQVHSEDHQDFFKKLVSANTMNPQEIDASEIRRSIIMLANSLRYGIKNPVLSAKVASVGSFFDDCKLSPADECDMCLVLHKLAVDGVNFQAKLIDVKNLFYNIKIVSAQAQKALAGVSEKGYLKCDAVHIMVYEALKDVLQYINLPANLTFARIYSSEHPGIQPNPPTITFHLVYKGNPLSFDFTPTLPAPKDIVQQVIMRLPSTIQERLQSSTTISRQVEYPYEMVDFVASKDGHWQLSTSCLEAHLLQTFKPMASIKQNIIACKAFRDQYLQLDVLPQTRFFDVCLEDIKSTISSSTKQKQKVTNMFEAFLKCMDTDSCLLMFQAITELDLENKIPLDTYISRLAADPDFLFHYTHPTLLRKWQIAAKKMVSSASCVFKYLMIRSLLENPTDPCWSEDAINCAQVVEILEKYKRQVQLESNAGSVRHGFLEYDIPVRSISLYAMDKRVPGVRERDILKLHTEIVERSINLLSDDAFNNLSTRL